MKDFHFSSITLLFPLPSLYQAGLLCGLSKSAVSPPRSPVGSQFGSTVGLDPRVLGPTLSMLDES